MKLNDSELSNHASNVIQNTGKIIQDFGDRDPGSQGEKEATKYLQKEFEPLVDRTEIQPFPVVPKLFMGVGTYCMVCCLLAIIFYWIVPWLGFIFALLGLGIFLSISWFYVTIFDRLLPQKESQNLMAIKNPKGEVRRRIVFHGHIDASFEMRWNLKSHKVYRSLILTAILFVIITFIICTFNWIFNTIWAAGYQSGWMVVGVVLTVLTPITIPMFLFYNYKVVSPGANDNLSGTLLVLEVAKICKEKNWELESTEIVYLVTGSEEAGTRGAKYFAERNKENFSSIETIFISLDVLADSERITFLTTDHNGMVKLDDGVRKLLTGAAKERNIKVRELPFPPGAGSTDAARFQNAGFPAGSILAVDHQLPTWYHTRLDTVDAMDKECLAKTIDLMLATLQTYDSDSA
ncbi:MAG: M28 family metallopeptidase [Promethearchaeota archaeon]